MLSSSVHVLLAFAMVALAAGASWLMLESFGGRTPKESSRRRAALHRALGRAFVAVYVLLLVSMTRLALERSALEPLPALHAALGTSLLPVLALKLGIVRRWEPLHRFLPLFGSAVFSLAVVTVGLGLLATHQGGGMEDDPPTARALPDHPGRAPFLRYCGQCHPVSRPLGVAASRHPDAGAWTTTVKTMRERAVSRGRDVWTEAEARQIVDFLLTVGRTASATPGGSAPGDEGDDRGRGRGRGGR